MTPRGATGRAGRAGVATVGAFVALTLVAACTDGGARRGDEGGPAAKASTSSAAAAPRFGRVAAGDGRVTIDAGAAEMALTTSPFALAVTDKAGAVVHDADGGGLFMVRNGARQRVTDATVTSATPAGVDLAVNFADGSTGTVALAPAVGGSVQVTLGADDPAGITNWGETLALADGEAIYGLTERIVDDRAASEIYPVEQGTLDRRGETVNMWVTPTMSGYAPFHQSSNRYGLLVDGTMPGTYDIGKAAPDRLDIQYETAPSAHAGGSYHLFLGDHAAILDQYTALTGRPPVPPDAVFTHWRGRDEEVVGPTANWHGVDMNASVATDLAAYERYGITPGIYHFDRPWAVGTEGYGDLQFDPARFPNAAAMLAAMRKAGWKIEVWVAPWVLDAPAVEAKANGWLAPNSPRALDLTNPDAVAWQQQRLVDFLTGSEGKYVDGFFMDRGDEPDVTSTTADVYHDGRTGREVHNDYPLLYARAYRQALDRARPGKTAWALVRPAWAGTQAYAIRWGGDTPSREGLTIPEVPNTGRSTDLGLRSVLVSMQRAAFMGTPYWGSDIAGYSPWNDRDLYARWIEVGAASPLMRFHGQGGAPWRMTSAPSAGGGDPPTTDAELLDIYTRYVKLHDALAPYLEGLAKEANRTGMTLVRPLVFNWPAEAGAKAHWDEWTLGPDLLVAPVWRVGDRTRSVWIPPGRWVDVWHPDRVVEGPREVTVDAPLATLPMYARQGAKVPDLRAATAAS